MTLDLNLRHMSSEMESQRDLLARKLREKDVELRKLKKADLQLKAARDGLQLVEKKHDNKQTDVRLCHSYTCVPKKRH